MGQHYGKKAYTQADIATIAGNGDTGWYNFKIGTANIPVYIDQDYDGGGWVCVLANRKNTAGMNNLNYYDALYSANYRHGGSTNATNEKGMPSTSRATLGLADVNIWIGLSYWGFFGYRKESGYINIVQYMAGTNGIALNDTSNHSERHRWKFTNFNNANWSFEGETSVANDVGSNSGMYSAHTSAALSAFDADNDTNSGSCSSYYNNNPWWYTSCWSGNMFAGGSYADGPHWTSSNSANSRQYGAVFIK